MPFSAASFVQDREVLHAVGDFFLPVKVASIHGGELHAAVAVLSQPDTRVVVAGLLEGDPADPVFGLGEIEQSMPVLRIAIIERLAARVSLLERAQRRVLPPFLVAHLADAREQPSLILERPVGDVARREGRVIGRCLVVHHTHHVQTPDRGQFGAQVAEHGAEEVLGLGLAARGVVARHVGRGGQPDRDDHAGERGNRDRRDGALPALRFPPGEHVVADPEQTRDQLSERAAAPVTRWTCIGRHRLVRVASRVGRDQCRRKSAIGAGRNAGGAGDDVRKNSLRTPQLLEGFNLGVDPARPCRCR